MIRVVGANPAMDRISTWPPLRLGGVNRASAVSVVPGGKGFNVARATVRLGETTAAYGFLGGHVGDALREMIRADGVIDRHTPIAAGTRVCFIVVEPSTGRSTVLNEPGPMVTSDEVHRFLDDLRDDCRPGDLLVLSGSLPDSVDPAVAGAIVDRGNAAGAKTLVDIHSQGLEAATARRPWMVKCNRHELAQLLEVDEPEVGSPAGVAGQMQRLRDRGIEVVVVTMGADGALMADDQGVVHARVPQVAEVNPTGSGDLLLAGLAVGLRRGHTARGSMVLGAACGTAGATHLLPELPPDFDADLWSSRIELVPLRSSS